MQSRNYYYFVATLPYISYGDKPPMSSGEFREQCQTHLEPGDAALVRHCCYDPRLVQPALTAEASTGSAFLDLFMAQERALVLNLACLRAGRLKRPVPEETPSNVPWAEAVVKTAFEMEDPLEAALFIDRSRWDLLEEMVGLDYFGVNNVFAYLMKLQLLERRQCFDAEKGSAGLRELYDAILDDYNSKA